MLTTLTLFVLAAPAGLVPGCPIQVRPQPPPPPPPPVVVVPAPPPLRMGPLRPAVVSCPPRLQLRIWTGEARRRPGAPLPYHHKITPYVGVETGYLALFSPQGSAFRLLRPTAWVSGFYGWNFTPHIGVEMSLGGSPLQERDDGLGGLKSAGVASLAFDARFRLVRPAPENPIVPYLQAGVGGYWFGVERKDPSACTGRHCTLALGVGAHLGGGLDFYLFRGAILGLRVLYRHLFLSALHCPAGTPCAALASQDESTQLSSLTATVHFTIFWSHR